MGVRGGVTFKLRWEETSQGQEQQKPARQRQEGLLCMRPPHLGDVAEIQVYGREQGVTWWEKSEGPTLPEDVSLPLGEPGMAMSKGTRSQCPDAVWPSSSAHSPEHGKPGSHQRARNG